MINCEEFKLDDGEQSYSVKRLSADRTVECGFEDSTWTIFFFIGLVVIFGYVVAMPIATAAFLSFKKRRHREESFLKKFSFLYDGYRSKLFFWELMIVARKSFLAYLVEFYTDNVTIQVYLGVWVTMTALLLNILFSPYITPTAHYFETAGLIACFVTLFSGLGFSDNFSDEFDAFMSFVLISINIVGRCTLLISSHTRLPCLHHHPTTKERPRKGSEVEH